MTQLAIPFAKTPPTAAEFDALNPWVMEALIERALSRKALGFKHYAIARIVESLRWDYELETRGDTFKLNNSHRAWYSREIMRREPRLAGFFRTRKSAADGEGK